MMDNIDMVQKALDIAIAGDVGVTLTAKELSLLLSRIADLEETVEAYTGLFQGAGIVLQGHRRRIAELERQVADLCPVGDLVGLPAWQVEKQGYMEQIAKMEREVKSIIEYLRYRAAELERVLRMVEWTYSPMGIMECHWCGGVETGTISEFHNGHFPDCIRQKALGE